MRWVGRTKVAWRSLRKLSEDQASLAAHGRAQGNHARAAARRQGSSAMDFLGFSPDPEELDARAREARINKSRVAVRREDPARCCAPPESVSGRVAVRRPRTSRVSLCLACEDPSSCARCVYIAGCRSGVYRRRLPLDPQDQIKGTWIVEGATSDGVWGVGCKVCSVGRFARFEVHDHSSLQICNLVKHHNAYSHRAAVAKFCGRTVPQPSNLVPASSTFEKVIMHKKSGSASRLGIEGLAGKSKLGKLLFCLREGARMADREFLRQAQSIAIHQDVAGKRLLIKYRAADAKLRSREGLLGHCFYLEHGGGGAAGLAKATKHIMRSFCTPLRGHAPRVSAKKQDRLEAKCVPDEELELHIRKAIEMYDTDAATDERIAGRLLKRGTEEIMAWLPNLVINKVDPTHAVKRTASHAVMCAVSPLPVSSLFCYRRCGSCNMAKNVNCTSGSRAGHGQRIPTSRRPCRSLCWEKRVLACWWRTVRSTNTRSQLL